MLRTDVGDPPDASEWAFPYVAGETDTTGDDEVSIRIFDRGDGKGWITCEYAKW